MITSQTVHRADSSGAVCVRGSAHRGRLQDGGEESSEETEEGPLPVSQWEGRCWTARLNLRMQLALWWWFYRCIIRSNDTATGERPSTSSTLSVDSAREQANLVCACVDSICVCVEVSLSFPLYVVSFVRPLLILTIFQKYFWNFIFTLCLHVLVPVSTCL